MKNFQSLEKCLCCNANDQRTFHHVHSQKSRPDLKHDTRNMMPLCLCHHNQIHKLGLFKMTTLYPSIGKWLEKNGWELCPIRNKWFLPL